MSHGLRFKCSQFGQFGTADLEFLDAQLNGVDISASIQPLLLLQLLFSLVQPGPYAVEVGVKLLPLLQVLLHA